MSRSQRQSNMVRTHTPADRLPSDFQVPAFLADLRAQLPDATQDCAQEGFSIFGADVAPGEMLVCLACKMDMDPEDFAPGAMDCHVCRADRRERELFALRLAVDLWLVSLDSTDAQKHIRAVATLKALSKSWQVAA